GGESGLVGQVAGSEDERRFLLMEGGGLAFEQHVVVIGAGDVPGAARARAAALERLVHCGQHRGVLTHAEIVVRAPDGHLGADAMLESAREASRATLEIGEDTITPLALQCLYPVAEEGLVVHAVSRHQLDARKLVPIEYGGP